MRSTLEQALALHRGGRLGEAQSLYEEILRAHPRQFDVLHLLGVLAQQRRNSLHALELFDQALAIDSGNAVAVFNRGTALQDLRRWDAALTSYDRAIAIKPDFAEAYSNRGVVLHQLRQYQAALASCDRAIAIREDYAEAWYNRANAQSELGQWQPALASYARAIEIRSAYPEAWFNRGNVQGQLGQWQEALASYDRALAIKVDYAAAYANRGNVHSKLERFEAALADYERVIALRPGDAAAHCNCANAHRDLRHWEAALSGYDRALQINPDHAEAHCNRGSVLRDLRRPAAAAESYRRAISIKPEDAAAHCNLGNVLREMRRLDEALASYDRALEIDPGYAHAHTYKAYALLLQGHFADGWIEHEWRLEAGCGSSVDRGFAGRRWSGVEAVAGKVVFITCEQGLGDAIQFCRYAGLLAALGAKVVMEVPQSLAGLFRELAGVTELVVAGSPPPPFDYQCPMLSLPLALATRLHTIPGATPYLVADGVKAQKWRAKLGTRRAPRVGLVWSGNPRHLNDLNRSMPLAELVSRLPAGFEYVSLQTEVRSADRETLEREGRVLDFAGELHDFSETAALCDCLDVVISVDTAAAHLSGALGKRTWTMLPFDPDWRWLLNRHDSPWYPTMKLYRQPSAGDWRAVCERIGDDLRQIEAP